jgi:hypothetical protein
VADGVTRTASGTASEVTAMYHCIQFTEEFTADIEISGRQPLERLLIRKGSRRCAQMRPYVIEAVGGPIEVADLFFEDGTATRGVPFSSFFFVE